MRKGLKDVCDLGSVRCSTVYPEKFLGRESHLGLSRYDDDMCQIDDKDDLLVGAPLKFDSVLLSQDLNKVINCLYLHLQI